MSPLISPSHVWIYHNSGPTHSIFAATILNVALGWLLWTGLLLIAHGEGRLPVAIWSGVIFFTPWLLIKEGDIVEAWTISHKFSVIVFLVAGVGWIAVMLFWRESFRRVFDRVQHIARVTFAVASLSGMIFFIQLVWCGWQGGNSNEARPMRLARPALVRARLHSKPRIIWIVLDELSYQQVYERRFPGIELPAFDMLAAQSAVFTHVIPADLYTQEALPSLITGSPVDRIQAGADGSLVSIHNSVTDRWEHFDPHQTVFQDAIDHGYNNAIAGWYNPYCRILSQELDQCFWTLRKQSRSGMTANASILSNVVAPWVRMLGSAASMVHSQAQASSDAQGHIADYRELFAAGDRYLSDDSLDFVMLHMPIPHPGGIYSRRTGRFGAAGDSYLDNLVLADHYLDHVAALLKQRGEWDSTAIVIMGDHSWRTQQLWASAETWTPEEQEASHGGEFDDRPGYIVKLPYQIGPSRVDAPFAVTRTRALFQGILDGSIRTSANLETFANWKPSIQTK
jgi:hypothetical protein